MKNLRAQGAIGISAVLSIAGGVAVLVYTTMAYVNTEVAPVAAQTQANSVEIAGMASDISWIKSALQNHGFTPKQVNLASTTSIANQ